MGLRQGPLRKVAFLPKPQPRVGDVWVACEHVAGSPEDGFDAGHVLVRKGTCPHGAVRWQFLCDACASASKRLRRAFGGDREGVWPEAAAVCYRGAS